MTKEETIEIRHRLGYSQEQLANAVGYSIGTIRRIEKGTQKVPAPIEIILGYILKYEVGPYAEMIQGVDGYMKHLIAEETALMKTQLEIVRKRFKKMDQKSLKKDSESSSSFI